MGFGIGIGIGWPNASNNGINTFGIEDCKGNLKTVYSTYPQFLPGAIVFEDREMTTPFSDTGSWNLPGLIYSFGGYQMSNDGEIKEGLFTC